MQNTAGNRMIKKTTTGHMHLYALVAKIHYAVTKSLFRNLDDNGKRGHGNTTNAPEAKPQRNENYQYVLPVPYPKVLLRGAPQIQMIKSKCIIEELSQRTVANNTSEYKGKNNKTPRKSCHSGHE
jgi:hypothetical protein